MKLTTGYACKECGEPSPVGVGYKTSDSPDIDVTCCPCGHSRKADPDLIRRAGREYTTAGQVPAGVRYAYYVTQTEISEGQYVPSVVFENVAGHFPLRGGPDGSPWRWGSSLVNARALADEANAVLGLTKDEALEIVASSFRA